MSLAERLQQPETRAEIPCPAGENTDLWVLAGQSNMQGVGVCQEKFPPDERIWMFDMSNEWMKAEEPLHRLHASRAAVHRLINNITLEQQAAAWADMLAAPGDIKRPCVGPGLFFARHLSQYIDRPVGLIPTAHGGTSMDQWSPALKDKGTESLYGAMLERIRLTTQGGRGGTLRGILWYQGEAETGPPVVRHPDGTTETLNTFYERKWLNFVDAVRRDTGIADLPIIYVQIGRFAMIDRSNGPAWEIVRDVQRSAASKRPNLYVVSAVDLPLDDLIHVGWDGQKRLGRRMAEVALTEVYKQSGHAKPIELDSIETLGPDPTIAGGPFRIRVRFKNVNGRLRAPDLPWGFELRREIIPDILTMDTHRADLDPDDPSAVLVSVGGEWVRGTRLVYAPGMNPYVNLTDEQDMPVPAFGPLPVPEPPRKP